MSTTTVTYTKIFSTVIFSLGLGLLLPLFAAAQTPPPSTSTVELTISKFISGSAEGFALSDFSYQVTGSGVDQTVPHEGTIDLGLGTYTIEELVPTGFVKADWRIGWYGDCDNGSAYSTTITIDDGNVDHGWLNCQADNQYRPPAPAILGCTDQTAQNYDPAATQNDGSCTYDTNDQYLLEGYVWHDLDEDGVIDEAEERLEDWVVVLNDGKATTTTTSDADGYYSFSVPAGTYTLREQVEDGWEQVFPTPIIYTVTVPGDVAVVPFPFNWLIAVAHAQAPVVGGPFNFGNVLSGGGSGGNTLSCSINASDTNVSQGSSVELSWNTTNASAVTIDNGIGSTAVVGTTSVTINADSTYLLSATNGVATTTCSVDINVSTPGGGGGRSPQCQDFSISDTVYRSGATYTLTWRTDHGRDISVAADGTEIFATSTGAVVDSGSLVVTPGGPTTYELTVTRGLRDDTCSVQLDTDSGGGGGNSSGGTGGGTPQILGEQVSVIPHGAPDTGFVGAATTTQSRIALGAFIGLVVAGSWLYYRRRSDISTTHVQA